MKNRLEINTLEKLEETLRQGEDMSSAVIRGLDLTLRAELLGDARLSRAILLGCKMPEALATQLERQRALIFPRIPNTPFDPFRASLYSPEELLGSYVPGDESSYARTLDGKVYDHFSAMGHAGATDELETLGRSLHDHAITDALQVLIKDREVGAIMGGHSMRRDHPMYLQAARLSRELTRRGFLLASGGGPGAMEATHLGAWFAERNDAELVEAVSVLSKAPHHSPIGLWLDAAFEVAERWPVGDADKCMSLGIPTWHYGHEPPARFALKIAKYFANSVREEGLLAIATSGVVYTPGSAGTIQEIFQDAAQNHYKSYENLASPMIFLGRQYWTETKPVYPLLEKLAESREYAQWLSITDNIAEAVEVFEQFRQSRDQ